VPTLVFRLPVLGCSVPLRLSLRLAHEFASIGISVPPRIQADSVEQAVEITKSCPALDYGQTVEVRAVASGAAELHIARQKMAD